jgi:hypothetical protein
VGWLIWKYALTAALVVAVSELAKRSDKLGAALAALPLVTLLAMAWLHFEGASQEKIATHARLTFWYVLPTLPMFLAFPWLLPRIGFWASVAAAVAITVACFGLVVLAGKCLGVDLV